MAASSPASSQLRLVTSRQPSRSSATMPTRGARGASTRIAATVAADTRNETALTTKAQGAPAQATKTPAAAGPRMKAEFCRMLSVAFAA